MSKVNHPFQVLVGKAIGSDGANTVLAAGNDLDDLIALGEGAIGIFNAATNTSIDAATALGVKEIYLASTYLDVDGTTLKIRKSAGQSIQVGGIKSVTKKAKVTAVNQVDTITMPPAVVGTEYAIRLDFKNAEITSNIGYLAFSETYSFVATVTTNTALATGLAAAINADDKGFVVATTSGANLILTTKASAIQSYFQINLKYVKTRQTAMDVALVQGFDPAVTTVVKTTAAVYPQGLGYDIRQKEYEAYGWNSSVYRQQAFTGIPKGDLAYAAVPATEYTQYWIEGLNQITSGLREDLIAVSTLIAIPAAATTAITEFDAILAGIGTNNVLVGFEARIADLETT